MAPYHKQRSMLFAFFLSLFAVTVVFAEHSHSSSSLNPSAACTQELEGVVYVPKNCAYNYLRSISRVLRAQSPLFWSSPSQAKSIIDSFVTTYRVGVVFVDAFGNGFKYPGDVSPISANLKAKASAYERAVAIGEGFSATQFYATNPSIPVSSYFSLFWNSDGQMYTVMISMLKTKTLEVC